MQWGVSNLICGQGCAAKCYIPLLLISYRASNVKKAYLEFTLNPLLLRSRGRESIADSCNPPHYFADVNDTDNSHA